MVEIPFNDTYYPDITDPTEAVDFELERSKEYKLTEFTDLLESKPADKVQLREVIEAVTLCSCTIPLVSVGNTVCERCQHDIDGHDRKTGQCQAYQIG